MSCLSCSFFSVTSLRSYVKGVYVCASDSNRNLLIRNFFIGDFRDALSESYFSFFGIIYRSDVISSDTFDWEDIGDKGNLGESEAE